MAVISTFRRLVPIPLAVAVAAYLLWQYWWLGSPAIRLFDLAPQTPPVALAEAQAGMPRPEQVPGTRRGSDDSALELTVVTFNMRHGRGLDGVVDLERVAAFLGSLNADIIALQEVDRRLPRSGFKNQAGYLAEALGFYSVFGANLGAQSAGYGNAILSRYPILASNRLELPSRRETRGVLYARIDLGEGQQLNVFTTHLGLSAAERETHVDPLITFTRAVSGQSILLGDFNSLPGSRVVEAISQFFVDTYAAAGGQDGVTFGAGTDQAGRIDYIFAEPSVRIVRSAIVETDASDHYAVITQIRVGNFRRR